MYQQIFEFHAELLKALAHPRRLEIIQLLRDRSMKVSEMQEMLGLPQANLSQHLMVLRESEVVTSEKKGKEVLYRLADQNFIKASDLMREVLVKRYQGKKFADELVMKMQDLVPVVKDPVCEMRVSPKTAAHMLVFEGKEYYFCATGCVERFKKNPSKFV